MRGRRSSGCAADVIADNRSGVIYESRLTAWRPCVRDQVWFDVRGFPDSPRPEHRLVQSCHGLQFRSDQDIYFLWNFHCTAFVDGDLDKLKEGSPQIFLTTLWLCYSMRCFHSTTVARISRGANSNTSGVKLICSLVVYDCIAVNAARNSMLPKLGFIQGGASNHMKK